MIFFLEFQFNGFHYSQQKFHMEMIWSRNLFLSVEFWYYFESNENRNVYSLHYVTQKFSGLWNGIWKNFSFHFLNQKISGLRYVNWKNLWLHSVKGKNFLDR